MRSVIPVVLRRMRAPLIVLVSAYSIAVLGFTLVPGVDDQGEPWRMSFFEAFYVVSYTGSTIGFGEVPYDFSGGQRLWTIFSIYLTVIAWLYSIGTIISLIQDPTFRQTVVRSQLQRSLRQIDDTFFLICGYGDSGRLLVRSLTERGRRVVVMDASQANIDELSFKGIGAYVPGFCLDALIPDNLITAGLQNRHCSSVLAVTDDDHTNLKIAITAKLLNPSVKVYCRAETREALNNMASFGTNAVVNPYDNFAQRLGLAIREPDTHRVYDWLSTLPNVELPERKQPPRGRWIICSYGRMGKALHAALEAEGIDVVIVDEHPEANDCPPGTVAGKGTEARTLREAGIHQATAVVAGSQDDADNLSIIMTARELNPDAYMVARQNRLHNKALFREAEVDLVMEPSYIIASKMLSLIGSPLLAEFLTEAERQDNAWNRALAERIQTITEGMTPETWPLRVSQNRAPALLLALKLGEEITLGSICRHPGRREQGIAALPLLLRREGNDTLLPDENTVMRSGDRLLFCGTHHGFKLMARNVGNLNTLRYVHTGQQRPDGLIWRHLARKRAS